MALRAAASEPVAVWPNSPSPAVFLPLVLLVVAIVPGFIAWSFGGLGAHQAAWGLCGLDVLHGRIQVTDRDGFAVAPLYAWCSAAALSLPFDNKPALLMLPSYVFGVLSLPLVFVLGKRHLSQGIGLLGCLFFGLNSAFLGELQSGSQTTCLVFFWLLTQLMYSEHVLRHEIFSVWILAGLFAFAGLVLCGGVFALSLVALWVIQSFYLTLQRNESGSLGLSWLASPSLLGALVITVCGIGITVPLLSAVPWASGPIAPWVDPVWPPPTPPRLGDVADSAPALFVLAIYGFWRNFQDCLKSPRDSRKQADILLWTIVALLGVGLNLLGRAGLLLALIPILYWASNTILAILRRELADREVLWLMIGTVGAVAIDLTPELLAFPSWLLGWVEWTAETKLTAHLGLDLIVVGLAAILVWHQRTVQSDRRRRILFGSFILMVIVLACEPRLRELHSAGRVANPWSMLHRQLADSAIEVDLIIYVGADPPPAPMRFAIESCYPGRRKQHVATRGELEATLRNGITRPLILVTDSTQRLGGARVAVNLGNQAATLLRVHDSETLAVYLPAADPASLSSR